MRKLNHFFIFLLLFSLCLQGVNAAKVKKTVVFYLQNLPSERVGTLSDEVIIDSLENQNCLVIPVDCSSFPKLSPALEERLMVFHKNTPALLSSYVTETVEPDFWSIFYLPAGYLLKMNIPVWNFKDHGADGSLEYIMDTWNNELVQMKKVSPVTRPEDMVDMHGNPMNYDLSMDVVYPSGTPTVKVPLLLNLATQSTRQRSFDPNNTEEVVYRTIFPLGFLTTGYAYATADHCFNPLVRAEIWDAWFNRSSLDDQNGLSANRAYIRYLKSHKDIYNLNGRIGVMGISKASYGATRLANLNNAEQAEHSMFNNTPNTKPQPWADTESTVDVVYSAAGNGTRRIPTYVDEYSVPMITSAGRFDKYGQWSLYPPVVNHFNKNGYKHLAFWMDELGHTYPGMGTDFSTNENRYVLFKKFFDSCLKPTSSTSPLEVFYIYPKENSDEVDQKGYSRTLLPDSILPKSMLDISLYEPITVRFLSELDSAEIAQNVQVLHKTTGTPVEGNWNARIGQTAYVFIPQSELIKNETYQIVIRQGLRNKSGQEIAANIVREFKVNIYRENDGLRNKYTESETQRLQDDITAGTYDEYILTTPGGRYVLTTTGLSPVRPSKSFTLRAADGLLTKPVLSFSSITSSTTRYMFYPTDTVTAVFEGLEIDGFNPQKTVGTGKDGEGEPNFFRTYTGHETSRIIIRDCYLHGFSNPAGLFRIDGAGTSLLIEESTFKQCDVHIVNFNTANLSYGDITIRNTTFSEISGASSAVSFASGSSATSINIDHCTMHNFNTTRDVFVFKTVSGSVQIRNSLFYGINGGFDFSNPVPVIDNCYLAGFATAPTGNISNTFSGTLPLFANVEGLHYGLTNQSHFVCNDGFPVGNTMYYLEKPVTQAAENISNEGFTISWQAVPRAMAYQVMLYHGSTLIQTDEVGSNLLYYTFTELTEGTAYSYRVKALHKGFGFDSDFSDVKEVQTLSTTGLDDTQMLKKVWTVGDEVRLSEVGLLEVYNLQGVMVYKGQNSTVYKTGLSRGIYIANVVLKPGERNVRKINIK